jgi:hypothetical protein
MGEGGEAQSPFGKYQEALAKLIPAEVVGVYLAGKNAIETYFGGAVAPTDAGYQPWFWCGWTVFSLAGLIVWRRWATSEKDAGVPPEWPAVWLAALAFLFWVYSFGDMFKVLHFWHPLLAVLLAIAGTFAIPLFYRIWYGTA